MRPAGFFALALLPSLGSAAFSFSLPSTGDTPVRSADFRGRPVALVLWASWSPPSRLLARTLAELSARPEYRAVAFIGVNFEAGAPEERIEAARRFAAEARIAFPIGLGDEDFRKRVKGLKGYPAVLFLGTDHRPDAGGLLQGFDGGAEKKAELERRLRSILAPAARQG